MTLTQLEYALAVDTHRHFGKAAKSCHVTQPTLSMQLSKLEDEMGIILFDRSKSPILPTDEGAAFLKQARVVIKEFRRLGDVIQNEGEDLSGKLHLAVIPTLSPYVIPLFAKKFSMTYPKVELIIEERKTEEIIKLLDEDKIDVGLLVTPLGIDTLIERVLFYEEFFLFCNPASAMFNRKKVTTEEIDNENLWILDEGHCFRDQVLKICKYKGKRKGDIQFQSGNLETLKNMVKSWGGETLLPKLAVDQLDSNEKKWVRSFSSPVPTREVSLVHNRIYLKEKFIEALQEVIINSLPKSVTTLKSKSLKVVPLN
ncbi:MAG: LysR family transcriptional regulator [Deltaproteobacteria bacterium]|jgi:LysR family transcriptional regulator, hydrogen peroxide-inducible genes activator|nr:MAG: LysR family transcriptional regulator [Deltaproteobacteria bacterium]